jgi:hypothetical protein
MDYGGADPSISPSLLSRTGLDLAQLDGERRIQPPRRRDKLPSDTAPPVINYPVYRPIMTELVADPTRTSTSCCTSTAKKASTSSALVQP